MAHIVVIGAGVGGVPAAFELRKKLGKEHRVTLIGASPYFEFTPSNPWIAVGWRKREQTRVALEEPLAAKGVEWISELVEHIDAPANRLRLESGRETRCPASAQPRSRSRCARMSTLRARGNSISYARCEPVRSRQCTRSTCSRRLASPLSRRRVGET